MPNPQYCAPGKGDTNQFHHMTRRTESYATAAEITAQKSSKHGTVWFGPQTEKVRTTLYHKTNSTT